MRGRAPPLPAVVTPTVSFQRHILFWGKLQTPSLRPVWAFKPDAASLAALRGGWDPASLGEVGERPLPRERSTSQAGPASDSGFPALRVTRLGLQLGWGPGEQRCPHHHPNPA